MIMDKFIGHRGISNHAPENTIGGFELSAKYFNWVELDACLSKDENCIVFHDETVDNLTNGNGEIGNINLDDALQLVVKSENDEYSNCKIPTLADVINKNQQLGLNMNIEIKDNDSRWQLLTDKIIDCVNHNWNKKSKILFSSFNHNALVHLRDKLPNATIGHLFYDELDNWQQQVKTVKAKSVHFWNEYITEELVQTAKQMKLEVYVYTVNNKAEYEKLIKWGVDGIFTDEKPENLF